MFPSRTSDHPAAIVDGELIHPPAAQRLAAAGAVLNPAVVILPDRAGGGYRRRPRGRSRGRLLVALPIHSGQPNGRKRPFMITAVALAHSGGCPR
jgi:hypothetical protein